MVESHLRSQQRREAPAPPQPEATVRILAGCPPRPRDGLFCCIVLKKSDTLFYKPFHLTTVVKLMRKHLFNGILTRNDESFRKNV
jgi:hypothetical protein